MTEAIRTIEVGSSSPALVPRDASPGGLVQGVRARVVAAGSSAVAWGARPPPPFDRRAAAPHRYLIAGMQVVGGGQATRLGAGEAGSGSGDCAPSGVDQPLLTVHGSVRPSAEPVTKTSW